jgi:hypothetical protein
MTYPFQRGDLVRPARSIPPWVSTNTEYEVLDVYTNGSLRDVIVITGDNGVTAAWDLNIFTLAERVGTFSSWS